MIAPAADGSSTVTAEPDTVDAGRLDRNERRAARIGAVFAVVVFWLVATCMQPWNLFDRGPYTTDFYDAQARALVNGHLDIPASVAGIEGFEIDGRTQIYFGIGPAVLRLPFSGLSDVFDRRLSLASELLAVSVIGLAAARLLGRARSLVVGSPRGRPWWFAAAAVVVSLGTPLLFFTSRPIVYHEAALWGAATGLAGLDLVVRWWRAPTRRHLVEAVALAAFAISCRPSSGAAPAIALGLFGLVLASRRDWRRAATVIGCALVPVAAFALVNWARFGSLNDVPFPKQALSQFDATRQETLAINDGSLFGSKFVPTNLLRYLSPFAFRFDRLFPFVTWPSKATVIGDVRFDAVERSGSIVTGAPVVFLLALVGAWWTVVRDRTRQWTVLVVAALASTISTFTFGYLAHRYLVDFVPGIVLLAAPAVWLGARWLQGRTQWVRTTVVAGAAALFVLGAWNQMGLAITMRAFSIAASEEDARSFAEVQYAIDDALFGGSAPGVERLEGTELPAGVPMGTIVVAGDCAAVYRYDGYGWAPLERRVGAGRAFELRGATRPEGRTPILTGGTGSGSVWTLVADHGPEGVRFTRTDERSSYSGDAVVPSGAMTLLIEADPLPQGRLRVSADGRVVLDLPYVDVGDATVDGPWTSIEGSAPFCESLVDRIATD